MESVAVILLFGRLWYW